MRFIAIIVAGAIGWLWFAARQPAEPSKPTSSRVRRADLTGLQLAIAAAPEPPRSAVIPIPTLEPTVEEQLLEESEDSDEIERPEDEVALVWVPDPIYAIDLSGSPQYQEIIRIESTAPIIDTSTASNCGGVVEDYTAKIPEGRDAVDIPEQQEIVDLQTIDD